jgi:hypothetical protein
MTNKKGTAAAPTDGEGCLLKRNNVSLQSISPEKTSDPLDYLQRASERDAKLFVKTVLQHVLLN